MRTQKKKLRKDGKKLLAVNNSMAVIALYYVPARKFAASGERRFHAAERTSVIFQPPHDGEYSLLALSLISLDCFGRYFCRRGGKLAFDSLSVPFLGGFDGIVLFKMPLYIAFCMAITCFFSFWYSSCVELTAAVKAFKSALIFFS